MLFSFLGFTHLSPGFGLHLVKRIFSPSLPPSCTLIRTHTGCWVVTSAEDSQGGPRGQGDAAPPSALEAPRRALAAGPGFPGAEPPYSCLPDRLGWLNSVQKALLVKKGESRSPLPPGKPVGIRSPHLPSLGLSTPAPYIAPKKLACHPPSSSETRLSEEEGGAA